MSDLQTAGPSQASDNQTVTVNESERSQIDPDIPDSNVFPDYELLTSSEYLQGISPFITKLVEIVGIVDLVKGAAPVKLKNGTVNTVCTIYIHNNDGERVQWVMWGDKIEKFIDKLLVQHVIHTDGALPKSVKDEYNSGTTLYELVLQSNTIVTDLGKIKLPSVAELNDSIPVVPLINVAAHKKIAVQGFVKTPWAVIEKQNDNTGNTWFGSIAADKHFLDVKISNYSPDYVCEFKKGQHVQCLGSVIRNGNSFFFCVQGPACITLVDSQVAILRDLLLCKPLTKVKEESNAVCVNPSKKLKMISKALTNVLEQKDKILPVHPLVQLVESTITSTQW